MKSEEGTAKQPGQGEALMERAPGEKPTHYLGYEKGAELAMATK